MSERRIDMTVYIDRPPDEVFAAWSSAEALAAWFAPMAVRAPVVTMDFETGGAYTIVMPLPDGSVHTTRGTFQEIITNEKIVMTWSCDAFPDPETLVEVQFAAVGDGTNVRVVHDTFEQQQTCDAHRDGWEACLGQLTRLLADRHADLSQLMTKVQP